MRIQIVSIIVVVVGLAVVASPAAAHVRLKSTSPARGSTASTSIRSVTATFTGPLRSGTIRVVRRGGSVVSIGSGGRDPRRISRLRVRLKRSLRAGSYTARWSCTAADGHSQRGSFRFRLRRG